MAIATMPVSQKPVATTTVTPDTFRCECGMSALVNRAAVVKFPPGSRRPAEKYCSTHCRLYGAAKRQADEMWSEFRAAQTAEASSDALMARRIDKQAVNGLRQQAREAKRRADNAKRVAEAQRKAAKVNRKDYEPTITPAVIAPEPPHGKKNGKAKAKNADTGTGKGGKYAKGNRGDNATDERQSGNNKGNGRGNTKKGRR